MLPLARPCAPFDKLSSNCPRLRRSITLTLALSHDGRGDKRAFDRLRAKGIHRRGRGERRVGKKEWDWRIHRRGRGERREGKRAFDRLRAKGGNVAQGWLRVPCSCVASCGRFDEGFDRLGVG